MRNNEELADLYIKIQGQMIKKHSNLLFDAIKALSESKKDNAQKAMNKLNECIRVALKENGVTEEEYTAIQKLMLTAQWQNSLKDLIMKGLKDD